MAAVLQCWNAAGKSTARRRNYDVATIEKTSNITTPTQLLSVKSEKYAYRRFGTGSALPVLFLQHFTGTLDNWDPAVTDSLAQRSMP